MSNDTTTDIAIETPAQESEETVVRISPRAKRYAKIAAFSTAGLGLLVAGYKLGKTDDDSDDDYTEVTTDDSEASDTTSD